VTAAVAKVRAVPSPAKAEPDPLARLPHLSKLALRGRAIVDAEAQPVDYLWAGILARDHHGEISGPSYSGKTTLAFLLAVAAANPTEEAVKLLGHPVKPIERGAFVVVVENENGRRSAAAKLVASCQMLALPVDETLDRVLLIARADMVAHAETDKTSGQTPWSDVLALGEDGHVGLTILDSRARTLSSGESNAEKDQAFAERIVHQAIKFTGGPVVVVSHTRKSGAESIEDIAGSGQRGAGADTVLLVTAARTAGRVLSSKVVFAKLRDGEDDHPEPVTFTIARTKEGAWRLTEESADGEDVGSAPAHERVHEYLTREGGEFTLRQIRTALALNNKVAFNAIATLRSERRLSSRNTHVSGVEREVFKARVNPSWEELLPSATKAGKRANHEE
jgi:hypothetical protein